VYGVIEGDGELNAIAVDTGDRPEIDGGSGVRLSIFGLLLPSALAGEESESTEGND